MAEVSERKIDDIAFGDDRRREGCRLQHEGERWRLS